MIPNDNSIHETPAEIIRTVMKNVGLTRYIISPFWCLTSTPTWSTPLVTKCDKLILSIQIKKKTSYIRIGVALLVIFVNVCCYLLNLKASVICDDLLGFGLVVVL